MLKVNSNYLNIHNKGLYIHIPFCKHICYYCDFTKRIRSNKHQEDNYISKLIEELDYYKKYLDSHIVSIYIGGGTPNNLDINNLKRLLDKIKSFNLPNILEYSIEINAELLTKEQVLLFNEYHVNRISIGVQTFNDEHIKLLNRKHTKQDVFKAVMLLKKYGITNINLDLIYGFFNQTLDNVKEDLKIFYTLNVTHISYYSLILEEKTKFYIDYNKGLLPKIDDDLVTDMYEYIIEDLNKNNFNHYEISNFSKNNYESVHNKIYWYTLEYIGLGLGASGYLNNTRYDNHKLINNYFKEFKEQSEYIDILKAKSEFLIMGLRLLEGISLNDYQNRFKSDITEDFDIKKLVDQGYLRIKNHYLSFTRKGLFFSNVVLKEFI